MSNEIQYSLTINAEGATTTTRKVEATLVRIANYSTEILGDSNIGKGAKKSIAAAEDVIVTIRSAEMAVRAFQMASGPWGWAYAITAGIATGMAYGNLMIGIGE